MQKDSLVREIGHIRDCAGLAIRRHPRFFRKREFTDAPANIVVSPGGAGSTFLMRYISEFIELNHLFDDDGLKHPPIFTPKMQKNRRILFVFGTADSVIASIGRRKWLRVQGAKLGSFETVISFGSGLESNFRKAVERQISSFKQAQSTNLLLLNFDEIWDNKKEIARFFSIPEEEFVRGFPVRKPRSLEQHAL